MQFLYPYFLFALGALAIPIILHLFYFRRFKKVYFTNVRFLKEVKEETSVRSKLRNLLVLAARLLTLLFLVFAFAQPFIPLQSKMQQGERSVSVFIDNSFSMNALSQDAPLLEKAKQRAREIVQAYAPDDHFQILTNDFEGRHQRLVSQEDALVLIDEVKASPSVKEMSKVLGRQTMALNLGKSPNKTAYILSDFQKNACDLENFKDTTTQINLIPLTAVQEKNISIDSVWFETPVQILNQTSPLVVKVKNHTNEPAQAVRLSLKYDGQEKPVGTLTIPANATATDTINISVQKTGWHEATVSLTDFPVQFDDSYLFSFNVAKQINVLVINENTPNRYLDAMFGSTPFFKVTNQSSKGLDYSKLSQYQLIILNELNVVSSGLTSELGQYVKNGGNLLAFPSGNAAVASYKDFLSSFRANELLSFDNQERQVATVNTDDFVFKNVFINKNANLKLPTTKGNFRLSSYANRSEEALLTYRDGTPFMAKYRTEKGNFYLCTAPLDDKYNTLSKNGEIFVPMLYKMAISTSKEERISYTIGKDDYLEADAKVAGGETTYKLKGKSEEFIPEQKTIGAKVILGVNDQIKEAGFYDLYLTKQDTLSKFAFNYDRKESYLSYFSLQELQKFASKNLSIIDANAKANFTQLVGERSQGISLWRWCVVLALLFLAIEILLLKFWKV